jgi:hypothetical protein
VDGSCRERERGTEYTDLYFCVKLADQLRKADQVVDPLFIFSKSRSTHSGARGAGLRFHCAMQGTGAHGIPRRAIQMGRMDAKET